MADQVVDIRKRIEEMRNEVSAAIVSNREQYQAARALDQNAEISISTANPALTHARPANDPHHADSTPNGAPGGAPGGAMPDTGVTDDTINAYKGLDVAAKMPAFQLNVRNQVSNRLLLTMIAIQVLTNVVLILMVWMKIG